MPANSKQKEKIRDITFGITDGLSNVLLYFIYVTAFMGARPGSRGVHYAFNKADYLLSKFNGTQLRRAIYNLISKGYIEKSNKKKLNITPNGISKTERFLILNLAQPKWDGKLYLVNYDIPLGANSQRTMLRRILLSNKAAMLQNSLYVTPFNPSKLIRNFSEKYNLVGKVLVSTLNMESTFHTASQVRSTLWEAFNLEKINARYAKFIDSYGKLSPESLRNKKLLLSVTFQYSSIAQDDPQLPRELLQDKYLGFDSEKLFHTIVSYKTKT